MAEADATRDKMLSEMRLEAGIDGDDCDKSCQAVYADELLKWEEAVIKACVANEKSIECRESVALRKASELARKNDGYYSTTPELRKEQDLA